MMIDPLPDDFFARATVEVARDLLGKFLIRRRAAQLIIGRIVESEAYLGSDDPAAHAVAGRTKRTQALFEEPGKAYIFRLHGHYCLNVVTETVGNPSGVLIRALEPIRGIEFMRQQRGESITDDHLLTNGPGKLCQALDISMAHYGVDLTDATSPLYLAQGEPYAFETVATPRIGITKAQDRLWRFVIKNNPFVTRTRSF